MSATNKTTHYELPVFLGSDKPAWLVDWNGAMADIDSAIYEAKTTADGAASSVTTVAADLATLSTTVSGQGTDISTLSGSLTTLIGTVNTITSLIGNGTPTTDDKTIIGAINELHADIQQIVVSVDADDVSYDNVISGLLATNVQSAIDELKNEINNIDPSTVLSTRVVNIGDSYCTASAASPNFATVLQTYLGLTSSDFFSFAEGGLGMVQEGSSNHTALTLLQANAASITDKDTITDVIVTVGFNDCGVDNLASIPAAVSTFMSYVKTTFKNAKVHYGFIGNAARPSDSTWFHRYLDTLNTLYNEFAKAGAHVMHGIEYIMHDFHNFLQGNTSHPSIGGQEKIGRFIYECMVNGSSNYCKSAVWEVGNDKINYIYDGNLVTVRIRTLTPDAGVAVTANNQFELLELDNFSISGYAAEPFYTYCKATYQGETAPKLVLISIQAGKVYVIPTDAGTITGLQSCSFTMPTLYA